MIRARRATDMYSVVLGFGCLVGLLVLALRRGEPIDASEAGLEAGLSALAAGIVGARLGFVAVHSAFFLEHPEQAFRVWEGGLSAPGGVLGAVAGLGLLGAVRRYPLRPLADALALPALGVALAAWIGCLLEGSLYGVNVVAGPLVAIAPDWFGTVAPRWPTPAVGVAATGLLAVGVLLSERRPWPAGTRAAVTLAGVAASSIALSFTRADPALLVGPLRIEAAAWAGVLALSLLAAAGWLRPERSETGA